MTDAPKKPDDENLSEENPSEKDPIRVLPEESQTESQEKSDAKENATDIVDSSVEESEPEPSKRKQSKPDHSNSDLSNSEELAPLHNSDSTPKATKNTTSNTGAKKSNRFGAIAIVILFIAFIGLTAAIGIAGYWMLPKWQEQTQSVASLQSGLQFKNSEIADLKQSLSALNQQLNAQSDNTLTAVETLSLTVDEVTQRLNTHNDRLLSLSNTSRDDWLLAEAHYLVRLAGQRILIDQNAQSALGLMEAADEILRDLSLPDLFPVRQALARDLAAIRLAAEVDREGIYLRLQGIAETVSLLPTYQLPEAVRASTPNPESADPEFDTVEADVTFWGRVVNWFGAIGDSLSQYFQIQHHDQSVAPLLPPSATEYLRQNLRFSIEQAQLAMLREEIQIYKAALTKAMVLVDNYFPESGSAAALISELEYLSDLEITRELPSINNSQKQLQAYIEKLHKLGGSEAIESEVEEVEQ